MMRHGRASPDDVERIRDAVPISTVVGRKIRLKKSGRDWSGLCCFHNEKTPSFHCDDQRGTFKCYGCGEQGDIFAFEMKTRGWSFPEALEALAQEGGIDLP